MSHAAFSHWWLSQGRAETTLKSYLRVLRMVEVYEDPPTLDWARAYVVSRLGKVSDQTVLVDQRALKAYSRWWAEEYGEPDPLQRLKFIRPQESPAGQIADEDAIRRVLAVGGNPLLKSNTTFEGQRLRLIISLLRDTGMRRGELAKLHLADVDVDGGALLVRTSKTKRPREVYLSPAVQREARRYLRHRAMHDFRAEPYLFLGRKGGLNPDAIGKIVQDAATKAGVELTPHMFRRRLAAKWAEAGLPDDSLMQVAGWDDPRMPGRYRKEAIKRLAKDHHKSIVG